MVNSLLDTFEQTERILLHLLENDMGDEIWDLSGKVAQKGICFATGIDALRRSSAKSITAVIPYFGYARQDRKVVPRTSISEKLVSNFTPLPR